MLSAGGSGQVNLAANGAASDIVVNANVSSASGAVTAVAGRDIALHGGNIITAADGNAVVLAAGRNFINNVGPYAILLTSTGNKRWLVYSADPANDTFGNLDSANTAVWNATYDGTPPASVAQTGNRYLFSYQPTVTFTSTDTSKTYGSDATATVAGSYVISGLNSGVANAYNADSNNSAFNGTPSVT